jgi:hypothetical protein
VTARRLQPDTRYYYRFGSDAGWSAVSSFVSRPRPDLAVRCRCDRDRQARQCARSRDLCVYAARPPDALLCVW